MDGENSKVATWIGVALSSLVVVFLFADAVMKLMRLDIVVTTMLELGWPSTTVIPVGLMLMACTLLYAYPRTSILGAVLLTGYLGAAVATHARISSPLFTHTLFGVYVGAMAWGGLLLRYPTLRSMFPFRAGRARADL